MLKIGWGLRLATLVIGSVLAIGGSPFRAGADEGAGPLALRGILEQVKRRSLEGRSSTLVFDLDETLIDSTPRRLIAFQVARESVCAGLPSGGTTADVCARTLKVRTADFYGLDNSYSFSQLWAHLGLQDGASSDRGAMLQVLERSTVQVYLSGRFEEFDREVRGAAAFVNWAAKEGSHVFYVSSRFERLQGAETRRSLEALGFFREGAVDQHRVLLRSDGESSLAFKQRAYQEIAATHGDDVVGVFENEPENMEALVKTFPKATAVFRDGARLVDRPVPNQAIHIRDFSF